MLNKINLRPNLYLFLGVCMLFVVKNIYFFFDVYNNTGTWGISNVVPRMWKQIEVESMPGLAAACLCGTILFAMRGQKKQALYFVAVFFLIFPFHLLVPTTAGYDGFFLLTRPESKSIMERLISGIKVYGHFVLMACTLAVMAIAQMRAKPAAVIYKILLGCTFLFIICCQVLEKHQHTVALHRNAVVFGYMGAWTLTALNFLNYSGQKWLRHALLYLSVIVGLAGSYCLLRQIPETFAPSVNFAFTLIWAGSAVLVFLYHKYPHSILTLIAPFIPLLCFAVMILDYQIFSIPSFDSFTGGITHLFTGNIWWTALACLTPALLAPLFREPEHASI